MNLASSDVCCLNQKGFSDSDSHTGQQKAVRTDCGFDFQRKIRTKYEKEKNKNKIKNKCKMS